MFDPGTITSTPTVVLNTTSRPGETSTIISSESSISNSTWAVANTPTPTILSTTGRSSTSSTSGFLGSTATVHSISAISLSHISSNDPTLTPTSTSAGSQTTITISVVQTAVLSSDTPQHTGFAHQTGAIIGIAIGGTFLLLLFVLLIYFACRYHSNGSYNNSSMDDIFAVSHNSSWRSPLETDSDDENYLVPYGLSVSANYPRSFASQGHDDGRFFGDHLSIEGSGSAESADANGASLMKTAFGGQPLLPPVAQMNSRGPSISPNYFSDHGHDTMRPLWDNTEPLNINKRNNSKQPLSVDSHVSARSTGSLGLGSGNSSNGHYGLGLSGEALLLGGKARGSSITEPRPIRKLSGRRHYSTPPTAFVLGRDSSLEYAAQRIQQHQEEQKQQDLVDQSISQIILARLRRPSTATVKSYSQCATIRSEESGSSRTPSHIYSPSLLNPPMIVPGLYLPQGVSGGSNYTPDNMINQPPHRHQEAGETSEKLFWPSVTLPPASSAPSIDTSSMVEGLLHPRLGMALDHSQQASSTSLRDHEDYTRPINGLVNNHIQSTTTFDTVDLGEGGNNI